MQRSHIHVKKLEALLDASKILNSAQDTDQILKTLLELSIDLIDGCDAGCIFLYNKVSELLEMYAFVGMGDVVKDVKMKPGESMTGLCFVRNEPIFFPDNDTVKKAMSTMSEDNTKLAVKGKVVSSKINSSICCPLLHRNETLGVLVVDNFSNQVPLVASDVELLQAISVQATIAIINAQNLEKELENNRVLEEYNKIIESQRDRYRYSTQVHSKFTNMVLKGSTIEDIIHEIKQLTQKDILLLDIFHNITHHALDQDNLKILEIIKPLIIQKSQRDSKISFYEASTEKHYFVFPIMVNKEALGWLCLISKTAPLLENEVITAERSVTILALEFLKQNELMDLEQSLKGDFLDGLIRNDNLAYVLKCSESYHFDLSASHRILLMDFSFENQSKLNSQSYERRIRDCIKYYYYHFSTFLKNNCPGSVALIRHHQIVCILEVNLSSESLQVDSLLAFVQTEYQNNYSNVFKNLLIKIGISNTFTEISQFKEAYENSRHTVHLIKSDQASVKWLYFKDIHIKRFLLANKPEDLISYTQNLLNPLLHYNNASREDFLNTLSTYLKSNCNWSYTKEQLHIHGNTLTYRLNRIEEILNLDLNNYQDRLRLQIAFEIQELLF
ncbi:helix-turn-helix domain-containing protein [Fusibacter ferrireducens]|uniref:Helix-turn-helix domain-containing protein n=1 Tax=Fusibacter ferrireducens TaxID=2785058 RepID=A0ABR9ZUQ0_9FIRM|nr:helix-turn-helix domain-containing protein [Fusibacter ferrireducens]MBF4694187.1 helix-turn-helix domain-containing protein [Fusibacter ferrireducens]